MGTRRRCTHSRSIASLGSSLIFGLFLMFLARLAYLQGTGARAEALYIDEHKGEASTGYT